MRILVVSNRLPFTATLRDQKLVFHSSPGGLVTGLEAYLRRVRENASAREHLWIGWPGIDGDDRLREQLRSEAAMQNAYPVFLGEKTMDKFYLGFCNSTLWPLFHYFPTYAKFDDEQWARYVKVNEAFRNAVLKVYQPGDIVWIHDYHLMLLPRLLREKEPDLPIGFFLHTPFPSYDIFRLLPTVWRREILEGLLGADLIGFHTIDYVQSFLRCILRILGYEHNFGRVMVEGERVVRVDTFPMGVDYLQIRGAVDSIDVQRDAERLRQALGPVKVVLSIDRLDYTKGIKNRLEAYSTFLDRYPQWRRRVVLMLSVVPSRLGVEHYRAMKEEVDKLVGNINGRFGTVDWTPIVYQYRFLPYNQLLAHYRTSDVAMVTPLRDGMNLIAKEYVTSRSDRKGVLILSEMAGASRELGEALIINPNDISEIVDALKTALEMPEEEQIRRNRVMQERLERYDIVRWGEEFTGELGSVKEEQKMFDSKLLDSTTRAHLIGDFASSKNRFLFLDFDSTLSPLKEHSEVAVPGADFLAILKTLSEDPRNTLVMVSGSHRTTLQQWFGSLNMGLVAEHGAWIKEKGGEWRPAIKSGGNWKEKVLPTLRTYQDRLPGSFLEEKEFSLAWHFRAADPELAPIRSRELADELSYFSENTELQVLQGSKVIEVRNIGINKGTVAKMLLSEGTFDFVLAIGDDWADEDLFKAVPEQGFSIKVGMAKSFARFNLRNHREAVQLLKYLIKPPTKDRPSAVSSPILPFLPPNADPGGQGSQPWQ